MDHNDTRRGRDDCLPVAAPDAADCCGDIVFILSHDGFIEFVNNSVVRLGYDPGELRGRHVSVLIHPDHVEAAVRTLITPENSGSANGIESSRDACAQPDAASRILKRFRLNLIPKGWLQQKDPVHCTAASLILLGEVALHRDYEYVRRSGWKAAPGIAGLITEFSEPQRSSGRAEAIARCESVITAASGIAHDFNNFLSGIYGNLQLARDTAQPGTELCDYLDQALASFEQARNLTQKFRTFANPAKQGQTTIVPLLDIVEQASNLSLCGMPIRFALQVTGEQHAVEGDQAAMLQLFCNILINACQAMPDGGTVEISVSSVAIDHTSARTLKPGRYEKIEIRDQGHGIPAHILPNIFDPYFTTKKEGTGVGLTTSLSIARCHGGHIEVASLQGKGATFSVYLPSATVPEPSEATTTAACPQRGQGRILVMDDEPLVREVACSMLARAGYEAFEAENGDRAITMFRQAAVSGVRFDAAILDLTVAGGLGGEKTINELQRIDPLLVAIALSGGGEKTGFIDGGSRGFMDCLLKPFSKDELLMKVAIVIAKRKSRMDQGPFRPERKC
ncbi:MAG: response regulator [Chitinispirillaceae bacterium]|nr:response regulator [Chitinispirillaceae bacterium]